MREIKFRVFDTKKNKYIDQRSVRVNPSNGNIHGWRSDGDVYEWELEQFTGLKDKNGKEIYEGDILLWSNGYRNMDYKGIVTFAEGRFLSKRQTYCADLEPIKSYDDGGACRYTFEVIGNIHEEK